MVRYSQRFGIVLLVLAGTIGLGTALSAQDDGWKIPPTAATETNPLAGAADAAVKGQSIYQKSCQRCHGADGKGSGPQSDPKAPAADLTAMSLDSNTDGVLFYKVWNGHEPTAARKGRMPAFRSQMVKDDAWRVVEFMKTLVKPRT